MKASKEGLLCRTWNNFFNRRCTHSSRRYGVVCFDPNFVSDHIFVCFDFIIKVSYVSIGNGFQSGYGVSNIQYNEYSIPNLLVAGTSDVVVLCMLALNICWLCRFTFLDCAIRDPFE